MRQQGRAATWCAVVALVLAGSAALARPAGVVARSGDKLTAAIADGDSDAFAVDLAAGSSLGVALKGTAPLLPTIRLFDPAGAEVPAAAFVKGAGGAAPKLKGFVAGPGRTGEWRVLVEGGGGTTGAYTAQFTVKHPAAAVTKGLAVPAGADVFVEFAAGDGAVVTATVSEKSGGPLGGAAVLAPGGAAEGGGGAFARKGKKLTLAPLTAASGFGAYRLRLTGGAADAVADVSVKVKFAKVAKRTATLPAEATFTSIEPTGGLRQGETGRVLTVHGANVAAGTEFAWESAGVTIRDLVVDDAATAHFTVDVAADAAFGPATLVAYPPPLLGEPALAGAMAVRAPLPSISSASPGSMRQLETGTSLVLLGAGFRDGGTVAVSGAGVTVDATTVESPTRVVATLRAAGDAPFGARDVSFTQPAAGGGDVAVKTGALLVYAPDPAVTAISVATVRQGASGVQVTLTGSHFRDGASVSIPGGGLTATNVTRLSDTSLRFDLAADASAPFGVRNLSYVQPPIGGGAAVTLNSAITVLAPLPAITGVTPAVVRQGDSVTLTVDGTGFRSGGVLTISNAASLAPGATAFVSSARVTIDVVAASDAAFGAHDVTYTQPANGGGDAVTATSAFTVAAPVPTVTGVTPASATQGASAVLVTVTGTGFRAGGAISFGGVGLTGGATTVESDTSAKVTADVAASAGLGAHTVTFTQPAAGGGASASGSLTVLAPAPTVTNVSLSTLRQDETGVTLTLTGTNFRAGGAITLSGPGLTLGATSVASATSASVTIDVDAAASFGARDVTFTQPVAGGGASATLAAAVTVTAPTPTIAGVDPVEVTLGGSGTLTVNGTGFRSGFALTAGNGVTLSNAAFVSATQVTADYAVSGGALPGTRDVTYTQPLAGGGAAVTKPAAFEVRNPQPTVTAFAPAAILPGETNVTVRVTGTGFNAGTAVTASGSGVTLTNLSSGAPDTDMVLRVSVASTAAIGARDVTITPGAGGGPAKTFTALLTVLPADPIVTSVSHATLSQGASSAIIVTGQNFRTGDALTVSGTGITFNTVVVANSTQLAASVTVSAGASTGPRDLTVTHAGGEGGRSGTLAGAFTITGATPTVATMNPSSIGVTATAAITRQIPVTITGTNFMSGATLTVTRTGGAGVSVVANSATVVSGTTMRAVLAVTSAATTGSWNLVVTNPQSLGNSGSTGNAALTINPSTTRTVNAVLASSGTAYGGERVTVWGAGFQSGDVVDFGGVRAAGTQVLDTNTLVAVVPRPASASRVGSAFVNVVVGASGGASATLVNGYAYGKDDARLVVRATFPAQGATARPDNLKRVAVLLSSPCDTSTALHGTTLSANALWFDTFSNLASTSRTFSADGRWLVFVNGSGTALPTATEIVNVPTTLTSMAGTPLSPVRTAAQSSSDQYSFGITSGVTDTTAPSLSAIVPANTATGVGRSTSIVLTFSEEVDPSSIGAATVTLTQSGTPVPAAIAIGSDLRTVTLTPHAQLAANTQYTTTITVGVVDLCANAVASPIARTFTTTAATDTTAPTVDQVIVESLPADLDGSGSYVNGAGTGGNAFDAFLPLNGFQIDVRFSDEDSGVDEAQFSAKASTFFGINPPNTELASNFTITATGATWRVPSSASFTAGENVSFTFTVKDRANNSSVSKVITVDLVGKDTTCTGAPAFGHGGGDHDPFDARRTWVLRADLDAYSVTYSGTGASNGAVTTAAADGAGDFEQALRYVGLNTPNPTAAAAAAVNGADTGTNTIVRRLVLRRCRDLLRARYGIAEDGTRGTNSVDVEFLLPGEQGSLAALPSFSATDTASSSNAWSEISLGGTGGPEAGATATAGVLGRAWIDERNLFEEANLNTGGTTPNGVFVLTMFKTRLASSTNESWRRRILDRFTPGFAGAVPVGEGGDDDEVLAASFDRTAGTNTAAQNTRYDAIYDGVEVVALYVSSVLAHEIGHSHGLVPDGAPKTGLFGGAHYNNTFTEATSVSPNTSGHLDTAGNDVMSAATSVESAILTGSDFKRFGALDLAHLLNRHFFDEGR